MRPVMIRLGSHHLEMLEWLIWHHNFSSRTAFIRHLIDRAGIEAEAEIRKESMKGESDVE